MDPERDSSLEVRNTLNPLAAGLRCILAVYSSFGVTVANLAIGGSQTWNWLPSSSTPPAGKPAPYANNIDAALASNPKVLMFAASTNDLAGGSTPDELINNLTTLRNYATARGVTVIIQGPIPRTARLTDAQRATLPSIESAGVRPRGQLLRQPPHAAGNGGLHAGVAV